MRQAVPAEDMMQAFAYRHLVPAQELEVAVLKRPNPRATITILSGSPVRVPPGATARIEVGLPGPRIAERAQFELSSPPEGITIQSASPVRDGVEIVLQTDAAKVKPGLKGNLIINGYVPRQAETNAASTEGVVQRERNGQNRLAKFVPEGIEGRVPYRGRWRQWSTSLSAGCAPGMGYLGCGTIEELQEKARFVRISGAGLRESHVHDVIITREAPNYHVE